MKKTMTRFKTDYPGVFYIEARGTLGSVERVYYIRYRLDGKLVEEKAGRAVRDAMTPAIANRIRALRIDKKQPTNAQRRRAERLKKTAKKWTFQELYDAYTINRPGKKSIYADAARYKIHIAGFIAAKTPAELKQTDIQAIQRAVEGAGLSVQTVRHVLSLIMRIVNYGASMGFCAGLEFKIKLPILNNIRDDSLSDEQVKSLLLSIEEDEDKVTGRIMKLALFSGLRRSEILNLQQSDIDLDRGVISLRNPKSGRDKTIPLNNYARDILIEQQNMCQVGHVFQDKEGKRLKNPSRVAIRRIMRRAGIPDATRPLHSLRHSFASALASSGQLSMYEISKLLTHSNVTMSQRYSHLRDAALKESANKADKIFEKILDKNNKTE